MKNNNFDGFCGGTVPNGYGDSSAIIQNENPFELSFGLVSVESTFLVKRRGC